MSTKVNNLLLREVDSLVEISEKLSRDAAQAESRLGPDRIEELSSVVARGGHVIRKLYGSDSQHIADLKRIVATNHFSSMHGENFQHVSQLAGLMKAVQHDAKAGLLADIRGLIQAEVFADFLEMAEHLLDEGYKDASAVLLGGVLEDSLRKVAGRHGVSTNAASGKALTIDPLNIAATKGGAYGPLVQKQITTWANLRNDAAHGHFEKYDADEVRQMLLFVQKFCGDHLP